MDQGELEKHKESREEMSVLNDKSLQMKMD
jgi:hypothetical protein